MIRIETGTGFDVEGEIVSRRGAGSHVVFALVSKPDFDGGPMKHGIYMCREYTRHLGRKHEPRLEWLGEIFGSHKAFDTRDEAIAHAMKLASDGAENAIDSESSPNEDSAEP